MSSDWMNDNICTHAYHMSMPHYRIGLSTGTHPYTMSYLPGGDRYYECRCWGIGSVCLVIDLVRWHAEHRVDLQNKPNLCACDSCEHERMRACVRACVRARVR